MFGTRVGGAVIAALMIVTSLEFERRGMQGQEMKGDIG